MGQHAGADIAAPLRQQADREPVHHDSDHSIDTLITVGDPEHDGLSQDREAGAAAKRCQLPLQIATKDDFFTDARAERQDCPQGDRSNTARYRGQ